MKTEKEQIKVMTKDEIKKALETCTDIYAPCNGCPYETCTNCDATLHTDAIKLITEQEKEIEKLKADLNYQIDTANDAENLADHLKYDLDEAIKQAKIDVLNKVKDVLDNAPNGWAYTTYIDELIAEVRDEHSNN